MATREGDPEAPAGKRRRVRIPHPHLPGLSLTQVKVVRLFTLLLLFSTLVLYAVFRSSASGGPAAPDRDPPEGEAGPPRHDRRFRPLPLSPSFLVKDVVLANDPRVFRPLLLRGARSSSGAPLALRAETRAASSGRLSDHRLRDLRGRTTHFSRLLPRRRGRPTGRRRYLTEASSSGRRSASATGRPDRRPPPGGGLHRAARGGDRVSHLDSVSGRRS